VAQRFTAAIRDLFSTAALAAERISDEEFEFRSN
jgi:hypothetical protein